MLWNKDGYCPKHGTYHMRGLYVGKGTVARRFISHYMSKDFSEEMLVYWSYARVENRIVKYLEQLVLDTFNLPLNRAERRGKHTLCAIYSQSEVDFGA